MLLMTTTRTMMRTWGYEERVRGAVRPDRTCLHSAHRLHLFLPDWSSSSEWEGRLERWERRWKSFHNRNNHNDDNPPLAAPQFEFVHDDCGKTILRWYLTEFELCWVSTGETKWLVTFNREEIVGEVGLHSTCPVAPVAAAYYWQ